MFGICLILCLPLPLAIHKSLTLIAFTGSFVRVGDRGQTLLQRLPAHGLQLADVTVRVPVTATHFTTVPTLAHPFGQSLSRRVLALQTVPAGQIVLASARFPLSLRAHQAAVTAVRHIPARTARARTLTHITALWTLEFRCIRDSNFVVKKNYRNKQNDLHFVGLNEELVLRQSSGDHHYALTSTAKASFK